ncbi:phosphate propanoyltransferase [Clostridium homopropionicum]|nr:phosphate propanoyltransferase [Clostridium homopropionicum]
MLENDDLVSLITDLVLKELKSGEIQVNKVPVSISARHIHLSKEHLEALFGADHKLTKVKDISQPGQFAAEEKVTLVGSKGKIENVRVLGPLRKETQVEISITDSRALGIKPVISESGNLEGTPGITIIGPKGTINIDKGCLVAERHIHMTSHDAKVFGVIDGQKVNVKAEGHRGGVFMNVVIRVREDYALDMHIDVDEANAFDISNGDMLEILK